MGGLELGLGAQGGDEARERYIINLFRVCFFCVCVCVFFALAFLLPSGWFVIVVVGVGAGGVWGCV